MRKSYKVSSNNSLREISNSYSQAGFKKIKISNNLTALNMVSSMPSEKIQPSSIMNVTIGKNIETLETSCFINCGSLQSVTTSAKLKNIGDYAFQNCSSLTSVSTLSKEQPHVVENIGVSAFANTGLTDIAIQLSASDIATQIGGYAFAGCRNLKTVKQVGSSYTSNYEFADCTALTSFEFVDRVSFVGEHVFDGCTGLRRIKIQNNCKGINDYAFNGCSNLTAIEFAEPSHMDYWHAIDNFAFNGTALTSITFPACITSFEQISPYALAGMDKLKELRFNGIKSEDMFSNSAVSSEIEIKPGKIYSNMVDTTPEGQKTKSKYTGVFETAQNQYKYEDYYEEVSDKQIEEIISLCLQSDVPLVIIMTKPGLYQCSRCSNTFKTGINTAEFLTWLKSNRNNYIFCTQTCGGTSSFNGFKQVAKLIDPEWDWTGASLLIILIYGVDKNGIVHKKRFQTSNTTPDRLISEIESTLSGFTEKYGDFNASVAADLFLSHCFGLNHDVEIYGKDGSHITYKNVGDGGLPEIVYTQEIQVDRLTIDDFKYGQWYFNAEQIREFADLNHIPVFVEYSSKNCPPCEEYQQYVYRDSDFQEYVRNKKILFCTVVTEDNFSLGPASYVSNQWANSFSDRDKSGRMPVMMMYWNKDGEILHNFKYYDGREFVGSENEKPNNMCYIPDICQWIDEFTLDYQPNVKFEKPEVKEYRINTARYLKYENQDNDDYGRYIPAKTYNQVKSGQQFQISVLDDSEILTEYTMKTNLQPENCPPVGTYMYYTTVSSDATYDMQYDISGLVFKIGVEPGVEHSQSYSETTKPLLTAYLSEINMPDDVEVEIERIEDVYAVKLNTTTGEYDQTTQYDSTYEFRDGKHYNTIRTYKCRDRSIAGFDRVQTVKLYTLAAVSLDENRLVFGPSEHVVISDIRESGSTPKLEWLSAFFNGTEI